ncbi:GNAT family N-acetyltransferase [Bdellovibrio bacteriovorus]
MELTITPETPFDYEGISKVVLDAFSAAEFTDGDEHNLVRRLRDSRAYIPELALVAKADGVIAGHILFTKIKIHCAGGKIIESLALAPVSVHPKFQRKGIGASLIKEGHRLAQKLGYSSVILVGHPGYYPRFGYVKASQFGISAPFDVPDDAFLAVELTEGALKDVSGKVEYPPEFGI